MNKMLPGIKMVAAASVLLVIHLFLDSSFLLCYIYMPLWSLFTPRLLADYSLFSLSLIFAYLITCHTLIFGCISFLSSLALTSNSRDCSVTAGRFYVLHDRCNFVSWMCRSILMCGGKFGLSLVKFWKYMQTSSLCKMFKNWYLCSCCPVKMLFLLAGVFQLQTIAYCSVISQDY